MLISTHPLAGMTKCSLINLGQECEFLSRVGGRYLSLSLSITCIHLRDYYDICKINKSANNSILESVLIFNSEKIIKGCLKSFIICLNFLF